MIKEVFIDMNDELLNEAGWIRADMGTRYKNDYNKQYRLYIRKRRLKEFLENKKEKFGLKLKDSPKLKMVENTENLDKSRLEGTSDSMVSKDTMGAQSISLTPSDELPPLSNFTEFDSLLEMQSEESSLVIAYDSEWYYPSRNEYGYRSILSWQFACIFNNYLYEFVFTKTNIGEDLSVEIALGRIFDELNLCAVDRRKIIGFKSISSDKEFVEKVYDTRGEALRNSKSVYDDGTSVKTCYKFSSINKYNVTLLCHAALFDLTAFDKYNDKDKGFINKCKSVAGGTVTLGAVCVNPVSLKSRYNKSNHVHIYPISLNIADTMCHTSKDKSSLASLGDVIGIHKIHIDSDVKSNMRELFVNDPVLYFEYASNDSVVTLLYAASLYGYNKKIPVTITGAGCNLMYNKMMKSLDVKTSSEFNRVYRGLERKSTGLELTKNVMGKCAFNEKSDLVAISDSVKRVHQYASDAYHGGYNICSNIGYYTQLSFDFDLKNAYPTAMCLVPDVNWVHAIKEEYNNYELTLEDFKENGEYNPLKMFVCYITYEFPSDVKYPCIVTMDEGVPLCLKSSEGLEGVYASGPELYLALKLGAKIFVKHGYLINTSFEEGKRYTLRTCVKDFVDDRTKAKKLYGKGCLEELVLKLVVNSCYGKISQDVVQKFTYNDYTQEMEDIGCSKITNPVSACFITSIVRAVLIAAQNQVVEKGYRVFSATTDGFISDCPLEILEQLDLFGFKELLEIARLYLTDNKDSSFWEIKHVQDDLLNFCTRGNVSLHDKSINPVSFNDKIYEGVCAHNGLKSVFTSDSYEDRKWLYKSVVSRTGKIENKIDTFPSLKEINSGVRFRKYSVPNNSYCDFDMKRKPVRDSFEKVFVDIDEEKYEIMNFKTQAFENIDEYRKYRALKKSSNSLRTLDDWNRFFVRLSASKNNIKCKIRDINKSILNSCIMKHRMGECDIKALDILSGKQRLAWINKHNDSNKSFTSNDWKNMARTDRLVNKLSDEIIKNKLEELINDTDIDEYL